MVIWVMGLSGAGKTTIGTQLYLALKKKQSNTVFLDGDIFRDIMGSDLCFSAADREKNATRQANLCRMLDSQNINVICCILSNQPHIRKDNRKAIKDYFEVFIDVSLETLFERDPKGLYKRVREGQTKNVVGIDIPFFPPETPDIIIPNDKFVNIEKTVHQILAKILSERE